MNAIESHKATLTAVG